MKTLRSEVDGLLHEYSLSEIEQSVVWAYLDFAGIGKVKNQFLASFLSNHRNETLIDRLSCVMPQRDLKSVEKIFELLIEPKDRKLNGAFYTPQFVVDYIVDTTITGDQTVCDPACGSGAFLTRAVEKIHEVTQRDVIDIIENNIYGCDISDSAIRRAKVLLILLSLRHGEDREEIAFNIIANDSLTMDWIKSFPRVFPDQNDLFRTSGQGFDVVIGNPPYVRIQDFGEHTKKLLTKRWNTTVKGNFNIYFPFFELGINILSKNGKLGYITPNNYFTSLAGEPLRRYLHAGTLPFQILDFNHLRVFEDATTYTCITFADKRKKDYFEYYLMENEDEMRMMEQLNFTRVNFNSLNDRKWRLLCEADRRNISKIESVGTSLKFLTDIRVGIATLKDSVYFVDGSKKVSGKFYSKKHLDSEFLIECGITRPVRKISSLKGDASGDNMRIIFPYDLVDGDAVIIEETDLSRRFPECYKYLKSRKHELAQRDKGKKEYPTWYSYGRSQGLNRFSKKLLTPTFSNKPRFIFDACEDSLFCNGYGIFQKENSKVDLETLQKVLNSSIMNYFARKTSVDIEGNYQCYQKNFIESFTIPEFSEDEKKFLKMEDDFGKIDDFLIQKYGLDREPIERLSHQLSF